MVFDHVALLLRIGVAFAFIYPAVSGFLTPDAWTGYFPPFVQTIVGDDMYLTYLLHAFGVLELIIGLWILAGRKLFVPSALATLILLLIVVFNIALLDVLFRDIPIMLMALALTLLARKDKTGETA